MALKLEESWKNILEPEFEKPYMTRLKAFLIDEKEKGQIVYPPNNLIFNALNTTPFKKVKVVILGQDPYHGAGQAHGLSFSVPRGINPPPSLQNMYKELDSEFKDFSIPRHGDLTHWAEQGVLLLNATLTVRANQAGSHQGKGWEEFTDRVITELSDRREGIVFLLWGRFAQNKAVLIDDKKHHVMKAAHPSPFSAYNGFFGSQHFSKTNAILEKEDKEPIDWQV